MPAVAAKLFKNRRENSNGLQPGREEGRLIMGATIGKESLVSSLVSLGSSGGHHCVMIGLDSSGKTTILYRLKHGQYTNTAPTIGFHCEKVRLKLET